MSDSRPENLPITISQQLTYNTIRIETTLPASENRPSGAISTGTGFFYNFRLENGSNVAAIVTNNHVIDNSISATLIFS